MDRITAINTSITTFICGILGCIPVLGLGFAIYAKMSSSKIRRHYSGWNPAENYRKAGERLAVLALVLSVCALAIVVLSFIC